MTAEIIRQSIDGTVRLHHDEAAIHHDEAAIADGFMRCRDFFLIYFRNK